MKKPQPPKDHRDVVAWPDVIEMRPIGVVRSDFAERFGTPRQASIADNEASVELFEDIVPELALRDLAGFDRVWLLAWLHLNQRWAPLVRPPRGTARRGVFATRAPHRPNNVGLSAVRLVGVEGRVLHLRGVDLIDGTPILDVKPYVPYCDAFPESSAGWVDDHPMTLPPADPRRPAE
jgi:tRNA (adenine37-N6)-methyltransferase